MERETFNFGGGTIPSLSSSPHILLRELGNIGWNKPLLQLLHIVGVLLVVVVLGCDWLKDDVGARDRAFSLSGLLSLQKLPRKQPVTFCVFLLSTWSGLGRIALKGGLPDVGRSWCWKGKKRLDVLLYTSLCDAYSLVWWAVRGKNVGPAFKEYLV